MGWRGDPRLRVYAVIATALFVLLVPASALADTTVGFDDLSNGASVTNQYANAGGAGQGFVLGPIPGPEGQVPIWADQATVTSASTQAHSPPNVLEIDCHSCDANESVAEGTFQVPRSHVYAYVGLLGAPTSPPCTPGSTADNCVTVTLTAYDAGGNVVGTPDSVTVTQGAGINTLISVTAPSEEIAGFAFTSANNTEVAIDDFSFDIPTAPPPPDFSITPERGDVSFVQGTSATDAIDIDRLAGSTGGVSFSASGLPTGVTASFAPNPAGAGQTVMTLSAAPNAPPSPNHFLPITVTGTPQSAAAGTAARSATVSIYVSPAFGITVKGSTSVDLSACTADVPLAINRDPSFPGPVSLSTSGLPAGVSATFSPSPVTFSGSATTEDATLTLNIPRTGFTTIRRTATITASDPPYAPETATISVGGTCALLYDSEILSMQITQGTQLPVLPQRDASNPGAPITYASIGDQAPSGTQEALAELAAFKPTVVRVYADLKYGPVDGLQVPAELEGYTRNTNGNLVPLPGSPIMPVASPPGNLLPNLGAFGSEFLQNNYAGVYTFVLPTSWEKGKIQLQAQLLPSQPSSLPPVSARELGARAAALPGQAPVWAPCTTSSCLTDNEFTISEIPFLYTFGVTIRPLAMIVTHPYDATLPDPASVFQWASVVTPIPLTIEPYASTIDISGDVGKDNSKGAATIDMLNKVNQYVCNDGQPSHGWDVGVEHNDIRSAQANYYCTLWNTGLSFDDTPVSFAFVNAPEPLASVAHELYHLFGRYHASAGCGAGVGISGSGTQPTETWPPDQQGDLQSIGLAPAEAGYPFPYEVIPDSAAEGSQWFDFLSYCQNVSDGDPLTGNRNAWVSVHNWNAVLSEFGFSAGARDRLVHHAVPKGPKVHSLEVTASVQPGGATTIEDVVPVDAPLVTPKPSGYKLIATNAIGATVAQGPMEASYGHVDLRPPYPIVTLTGVIPAAGATAVRIVADGTTIASRTESSHAPIARITRLPSFKRAGATLDWHASEVGGATLDVEVDYSGDGGRTWHAIWIGANSGSAFVPARYLYRSSNARLRVVVNDGFRTASAISRRFRAPGAPPSVHITLPMSSGTKQSNAAPLVLSGQAFDDSSKVLSGKRLRWLLGGRLLGTGSEITATGLPAGRHRITLVATDRFGRRGSASIAVILSATRPVFIVLRVPRSVGRTARVVRVTIASSLSTTLTVHAPGLHLQRFTVGRSARRLKVRIRRGRATLALKLALGPRGLARNVTVSIRR